MSSNARLRVWSVLAGALVVPAVVGCGSESSPSGPSGSGGKPPGGGPSGEVSSTYKSGSRLRARVQQGQGGAVRFIGWQDTKLKQACAYQTASDVKIRCLPVPGQGTSLAYLDANCTQPVGVRPCNDDDKYVTVEGDAACDPADTIVSVYELGDSVADAQTYSQFGTSCLPNAPTVPGTLHAVTKVRADTFALGTLDREPHGHVVAEVLKGEDGSRQIRGLRDAHLDVSCSPQLDSNGAPRCAPSVGTLSAGVFYSDAACAEPLLAQISAKPTCDAPKFAVDSSSLSACGAWSAIEVGKKFGSTTIYQGGPSACIQAAFLPPDWAFYEPGPAVDTTSLPPLNEQALGKGRVTMPLYTGSDNQVVAQGKGFFDSQLKETCIARPFADGKTRCVPDNVQTLNFYSDAACTTPLASLAKDPGCPAAPPTMALQARPPLDPSCPSVLVVQQLRSVGAKWTGPLVYTKGASGTCTGLDPTQLNVDLFDVGDPVDPTTLSEVTETIE